MFERETHPVSLGVLRFFVFGLWFLKVLFTPMGRYAALPFELFEPWGVFRLLPMGFYTTLMEPGALLVFKVLLLLLLGLAAIGARPFMLVAIPASILVLFFDAIMKGFNGFINHAQFGLLYAALLLSIFPACADRFSVFGPLKSRDRPTHEHALPYMLTVLILCLAYALVGGRRFAAGGLEVFTGEAIAVYLAVQSVNYSPYGFDLGLLAGKSIFFTMFFQAGFFVTTIFELLSPLVLVWKWFRALWLLVIIPFHVMTLFTMNIFFWENMLLSLVTIGGVSTLVAWQSVRKSGRENEDTGEE